MSATSAGASPRIAAMAPSPAGTASCMYRPRSRTSFTAVAKSSPPAATSAEYSPKLCPATKSGVIPCLSRARYAAVDTVRMAGCVFSVCFSASSEPSKQSCEIENPSAASASSNTARDSGNVSARLRPMHGYCEACPGKRNAILPIRLRLPPFSGPCPNGGGGKLLFDLFVQMRAAQFVRHADGVLDGVWIRPPVPDDGDPSHAQQRRATVFGIIRALAEGIECAL